MTVVAGRPTWQRILAILAEDNVGVWHPVPTIIKRVGADTPPASVFAALDRLAEEGWAEVKWAETDPPTPNATPYSTRFYILTEKGASAARRSTSS